MFAIILLCSGIKGPGSPVTWISLTEGTTVCAYHMNNLWKSTWTSMDDTGLSTEPLDKPPGQSYSDIFTRATDMCKPSGYTISNSICLTNLTRPAHNQEQILK